MNTLNIFRRRPAGDKETLRENKKKEKVGRPSLRMEITEFIYFFLRLRIAFRTTARMLAMTIPFLKNMLNSVGRLLNKLLLLKPTPTAIDTAAIKKLCSLFAKSTRANICIP